MPTFVILGKLTQKAIEDAKGIAERDAKAEQIIKAAGGKLISLYYTLGRYDFVAVIDMPSPESLVKVIVGIGKWGTVSTESMTAILPEHIYRVAKET